MIKLSSDKEKLCIYMALSGIIGILSLLALRYLKVKQTNEMNGRVI